VAADETARAGEKNAVFSGQVRRGCSP
jgi:hypothetical protein